MRIVIVGQQAFGKAVLEALKKANVTPTTSERGLSVLPIYDRGLDNADHRLNNMVHLVKRNDLFTATRGRGAFLNSGAISNACSQERPIAWSCLPARCAPPTAARPGMPRRPPR